jgi:DNA-binding beta-propeller fold protein YncE
VYRLTGDIPIGGDGGWDYLTVDSAAHRLYVSHATHVVVVDLETKKVVGDIPDTPGVHGIAIAADLHRAFVSSGRANTVKIVDLDTLAPIAVVPAGENPDAIRYDAVSGRVLAFNGRSHNATVIDGRTGSVVATIPLAGKPEFAVADGKGMVYVNIEDTSQIAAIDAKRAEVTKVYSLKPCEEPSGLAIDAKARRLFSVCDNHLMAISDPDAGTVVTTVPIGSGPDGAAFDPASGRAFSSNGEGTLTVIGQASGKWEVEQTMETRRGARTIALDETTHRLYLPTASVASAPAGQRPTFAPGSFTVLVAGVD